MIASPWLTKCMLHHKNRSLQSWMLWPERACAQRSPLAECGCFERPPGRGASWSECRGAQHQAARAASPHQMPLHRPWSVARPCHLHRLQAADCSKRLCYQVHDVAAQSRVGGTQVPFLCIHGILACQQRACHHNACVVRAHMNGGQCEESVRPWHNVARTIRGRHGGCAAHVGAGADVPPVQGGLPG